MSFNANKLMTDLVAAALTSAFPTHLSSVASEQSLGLSPLRAIYTVPSASPLFPSAEITPVHGTIKDDGGIISTCDLYVIVSVAGQKPESMRAQLVGYCTALVRTFTRAEYSGHYFEAVEFDMSPPYATSPMELVQSVGVMVRAYIAESAA